jgi:beta-phosphoglucomutase family hydrolase
VRVCLFDLDGVLTRTAEVHAAAWKQTFDAFLRARANASDDRFRPFDPVRDYDEYVDGRPRRDGVRAFLTSRGIALPEGHADDAPSEETVAGLGNRKDRIVRAVLREKGVRVYDGSVRYVRAVRSAGLVCAVVSSSAHAREILTAAGIADLFDARVDGVTADREHLRGKPAADTYLAGARAVGARPDECAVFEDALAGVEAGRAGGFAFVVGVDRVGQADALRRHGADVVVSDLADLMESR